MLGGVFRHILIHCFVWLCIKRMEGPDETVRTDEGIVNFPDLITEFAVGNLAAVVGWALGLGRVGDIFRAPIHGR